MATKRSEPKKIATRSHLDFPLAEMQRMFHSQLDGITSIKTTIRAVFGSASLIVSLIGALQLFTAPVPIEWLPFYRGTLALIAVLYVVLILVCVAGMWPVAINPPLNALWDELTTVFKGKDDQEMITMYLSAVLQAIEFNAPIVKRFYKLQVIALILLPILVVLILSLAWLPRV